MSKAKRKLVDELHAPARKNFPRRRVVLRGIDDLWQADIVDMRAYARSNSGHQYILTVIDAFTKYAWAIALKTKSANDVVRAFGKIIQDGGRKPKNLQTDDGREFFNAEFKRLTDKHSINHYSTYSPLKASIVERWNRMMKNRMWKIFTINGNYKWLKSLPALTDEYNHRVHRTTCMRPIDATSKHEKNFYQLATRT
ncbi:hypothetical protein KPH14_000745 [Odynerus spinipes]|uniref:Integrase catalytic domain-containing protein n=1 Tax=Odynerus spinipes TaxID=1348599 RepID=A0AAD9RDW1_9HYME|nr:hypothetical protein KPH14_000745 [Odynerus spinipes]